MIRNILILLIAICSIVLGQEIKTCFYSAYNNEVESCLNIISPSDKVFLHNHGLNIPCDNKLKCLTGREGKGTRVVISSGDIQVINVDGKDLRVKKDNIDGKDLRTQKDKINDECIIINKDYKSLTRGFFMMIGEFHDSNSIYDYIDDWSDILKTKKLVDKPTKRPFTYNILNSIMDCCFINIYEKKYYFKTKLDGPSWNIIFYKDGNCLNELTKIERRHFTQNKIIKQFNDDNGKFNLMDVFSFDIDRKHTIGVFKFDVLGNNDQPTKIMNDPNGVDTVYITIYDYTEESRNKFNCDKYTKFEQNIQFGEEKWSFTKGDCPELIIRVRLSSTDKSQNEHTDCIHFNNFCIFYKSDKHKIIIKDKLNNDVISTGEITDKSLDKNLFGGYSTISSRNSVGNKFAILAFKINNYQSFENKEDFKQWMNMFTKID